MDKYTATELAFKHGYEKGYAKAKAEEKHGHWIIHKVGKKVGWAECSECFVCGSSEWKRCPVCEMPSITKETKDALKKMGEKVHGE